MDMNEIRRTRLSKLIAEQFDNKQSEFIKKTGINQGELSAILRGKKSFGEKKARKLEEHAGLPKGWFDNDHSIGTPIEAADDTNPPADAVQIRRVKFEVSAGISGTTIEQTEEAGNPIYFRIDWLARKGFSKDHLVAVYIKGESMEPGLYEGDTIIVNTADRQPQDGTVFVCRYEGETVVKRLVRDAGKWWLSSDNLDQRRFPRKECLDDICEIIGKVVYKQSERV